MRSNAACTVMALNATKLTEHVNMDVLKDTRVNLVLKVRATNKK